MMILKLIVLYLLVPLPIAALTEKIVQTTTVISLIAVSLFAVSWIVGSLLRGAPIPWRDIKEQGLSLQQDALRALLLMSLYSSIATLIAWVVSVIALAA
jgi:hypothetical protein